MWAMKEPAGTSGRGLAGGGVSAWPVGGGKSGRAVACAVAEGVSEGLPGM